MLFAALFSSYILLRIGSVEWPHGWQELNVPMAALNTVVLIASSVTMVMAWASLKVNDFGKFRLYLGLTILAAFIFLVVKYFEYAAHFAEGAGPEVTAAAMLERITDSDNGASGTAPQS